MLHSIGFSKCYILSIKIILNCKYMIIVFVVVSYALAAKNDLSGREGRNYYTATVRSSRPGGTLMEAVYLDFIEIFRLSFNQGYIMNTGTQLLIPDRTMGFQIYRLNVSVFCYRQFRGSQRARKEPSVSGSLDL